MSKDWQEQIAAGTASNIAKGFKDLPVGEKPKDSAAALEDAVKLAAKHIQGSSIASIDGNTQGTTGSWGQRAKASKAAANEEIKR